MIPILDVVTILLVIVVIVLFQFSIQYITCFLPVCKVQLFHKDNNSHSRTSC